MRIQRDLAGLRNFLDTDAHTFGMVGDQYSGKNEMEAYQVCTEKG